jgi:integrase
MRRPLRIPTSEDTRRLLEHAEGLCAIGLLLAATTGLRRSEVLALAWSDVDLDAAVLRVRRGKTARSRRQISLPPVAIAALRRHRAEQIERRLLCISSYH